MICRRRSSLFKLLLAFLAIWLFVVFFFSSDNHSSDSNVILSPQMLQQPDAKAYDKNNKLKHFLIDGFKDAHNGFANAVVNRKFPQVNPFDKGANQEVDENEMINVIAGEHEDEVRLEEQQHQEEKKAPTKPKVPSKKRFGGKDNEDVGFIPPPNDLGLDSPGK